MSPPGLSWHRSSQPIFTGLLRECVLRSAPAGNADLLALLAAERQGQYPPPFGYYSSLPSAHNPRMPSVSASKSAKYPQLSQGTLTTPASSMRSF
jgi:hypothetical protein